ncbi:hypothetical protein K4B79_47155 [Streptomyces lincolnensis]|uniref:hypothetical protein n=1 Tax=Streptomyces lincolnensis TaxID=1915 RepID=UPI001E39B832|nr:hypothetical protein [Streptomyces lincolnensis]MCD7445735.1 hypothetical protein [Streptomyces lincolnensis]
MKNRIRTVATAVAGIALVVGSQGSVSAAGDTPHEAQFSPIGGGGVIYWNDYYPPHPTDDADSFTVADTREDSHGVFLRVDHPNGQTYFKAFNHGYGGGGIEFKPANLANGQSMWIEYCLSEKSQPIESTCATSMITE